ncbi:membrane protein [Actinoplanes ianthinogenes]|uniref:Membrane protein n=1 Tax=Actinoplanes ianthinogenes TaxID=122358 RepID=A0ABN6C723_9ACTN|nr:peptidase C39 family protein [Actinoplanes ianthinogenes]BCJ40239.1 membrane protein [Actinoplanes ianthinogenes]GGR11139.1 membrane protein [Actinoplanes ianthinogenes]
MARRVTPVPGAGPATHDEQITYRRWSTLPDWLRGERAGTVPLPGLPASAVTIGRPAGTTDYADPHTGTTRTWEYATWTAPVQTIGYGASELVASWNADTPAGTWLQVEMRGTYTNGEPTPWFVMGRWASGDGDIKRTSVDGQGDPYSSIRTDTFSVDDPAKGVLLADYQLRLTLYRAPGSRALPRVRELGAMTSFVPDRFEVAPSAGRIAWGRELAVPRRSQNIHVGEYPEYGGGEAWCSPASTTMVLEYWGRNPGAAELSQVGHAARSTYDHQYEGAGNWPFNTAYAATYGLTGIVTRLHSLDEAERFVAAGIPVITSQSFLAAELDGATYGTAGHLMVIIGFTADGDVIVNDPASPSNDAVRHVYRRAQFEQVWRRTKRHRADGSVAGGSGGVAYLIKPWWKPWPRVAGSENW